MARGRTLGSKNKSQKSLLIETPTEDETSEEPVREQKQRTKTIRNTKVEIWSEPAQASAPEIAAEEPELDFEDEEVDAFDSVLADFGGDTQDWSIKVWRLPDYAKRGNLAIRGNNREFCDNLPITTDYMTIIKEQWGPGVYQLELRERNRVRKIKTVQIAAPSFPALRSVSTPQNPTAMNSTQAGAIPYEQPDPIAQVKASLGLVKEIRQSFGIPDFAQSQLAQTQQKEAEDDGGDPLVKSFLSIAMADDTMRAKAISGLGSLLKGNGAAHETTWLDLLDSAIKADLVPKMFQKAKELLIEVKAGVNGSAGSPAPEAQSPARPFVATPPGSAPAASQTPAIATEEQVIQRALQTLLITCSEYPLHVSNCQFEECRQAKHMMGVANWILDYETTYPQIIGPLINDLLKFSPDEVIATLNLSPETAQYTSLPHCRQWIEDLQDALRKASEPEGDQP